MNSWEVHRNRQILFNPICTVCHLSKNCLLVLGSNADIWKEVSKAMSQKQFSQSQVLEVISSKFSKSKFSKVSSRKRVLESEFSKASSRKWVLENEFSKASSRTWVLENVFLQVLVNKKWEDDTLCPGTSNISSSFGFSLAHWQTVPCPKMHFPTKWPRFQGMEIVWIFYPAAAEISKCMNHGGRQSLAGKNLICISQKLQHSRAIPE
jgi:hypothetical protein